MKHKKERDDFENERLYKFKNSEKKSDFEIKLLEATRSEVYKELIEIN